MKLKLLPIFIFALSTAFFSCSKSSTSHSYPIVGSWSGTRTIDNTPTREDLGVLTYHFDIKADSSISTQGLGNDGNTYYYQGTWALDGTAFKGSVYGAGGINLILSAVFNSSGTLTSGRWENSNGSAAGTFEMKRDNE
jgi:hypothetical protein